MFHSVTTSTLTTATATSTTYVSWEPPAHISTSFPLPSPSTPPTTPSGRIRATQQALRLDPVQPQPPGRIRQGIAKYRANL